MSEQTANPARVLAVDDDPAMTELIRRTLQREGFEVVVAYHGSQALKLAAEQTPDLIVLDIVMPQMNGIQVCQALRSDPNLASVPVLFLTAKGMIEDKLAAFEAGGDDYLTKPFDLRELVARVRALLRRTHLAPPKEAGAPPTVVRPETSVKVPDVQEGTFLEAYALGPARVVLNGRTLSNADWDSITTKELFFFFLANPNGLRREQVLEVFWPDAPLDRANSNFHSSLYRLRRAISRDCVIYEDGWYRLGPKLQYWYDVEVFLVSLNQAEECSPGSPQRAEALRQAIQLYRGDYLEEFYSDWPYFQREYLRERYIGALVALGDYWTQQGEHHTALELYKKALNKDRYREDVLRKIVASYTLSGNRGAARRYYEQWRALYEAELGAAPEMEPGLDPS